MICGIAKGCQDGFNALKDDDDTRDLAFELEELYTKVPQQEEDVERMKQILQAFLFHMQIQPAKEISAAFIGKRWRSSRDHHRSSTAQNG